MFYKTLGNVLWCSWKEEVLWSSNQIHHGWEGVSLYKRMYNIKPVPASSSQSSVVFLFSPPCQPSQGNSFTCCLMTLQVYRSVGNWSLRSRIQTCQNQADRWEKHWKPEKSSGIYDGELIGLRWYSYKVFFLSFQKKWIRFDIYSRLQNISILYCFGVFLHIKILTWFMNWKERRSRSSLFTTPHFGPSASVLKPDV